MKEEDFIREKCGSKDPFHVPEGYFEHFTADLMAKLPEKPAVMPGSRTYRMPQWTRYVAAAVLCGLAVGGGIHFSQRLSSPETNTAYTTASTSDSNRENDIDEYLDYAMMSNQEIAQYLTEAY